MRIGAPGADLAGGAGFAFFCTAGAGASAAGAGAGAAPGAGALGLNIPVTGALLPDALLPDSTVVTPVVRLTSMRSPVSTLVPWVTTTLPVSVMALVLMSNTPFSPLAV